MERLAEGDRPAPAVLPPPIRSVLLPLATAAALLVLVLGLRYAGAGLPGRLDARLLAAVEGTGARTRHLAVAVDFLGEPLGAATLIAAVVAGCLLLRRPRAAVLVVAGVGAAVLATRVLKHLVGRTIHGDGNLSYPSGHTAFLTALALVAVLLAVGRSRLGRAAGTSLVLLAALLAGAVMGWAQVVLSAHYPTDALGGWFTALAVVPVTAWTVDRVADSARRGRSGRPPV
ncbi:phosphatase PAP2 family protein [Streptomyces sp. NPDC087908]|uniref:phosphatase PAP2 family protein n=1 Tax=unclassified Streptomyces TaxID=2593676 RepID=UPI001650AF2B|nr:phosphatase PAP2 family protein [Streptomyces sp. adm13(2018)]